MSDTPTTYQHPHSINAEEFARIIAKQYEPDLDWDNPAEYDLLDRTALIESSATTLEHLAWNGFIIQRLDDLALDEIGDTPVESTPSTILPVWLSRSPWGSTHGRQ